LEALFGLLPLPLILSSTPEVGREPPITPCHDRGPGGTTAPPGRRVLRVPKVVLLIQATFGVSAGAAPSGKEGCL